MLIHFRYNPYWMVKYKIQNSTILSKRDFFNICKTAPRSFFSIILGCIFLKVSLIISTSNYHFLLIRSRKYVGIKVGGNFRKKNLNFFYVKISPKYKPKMGGSRFWMKGHTSTILTQKRGVTIALICQM